MKKLKASSQYKKDYKRFRNNPAKVEKLFAILEKLNMIFRPECGRVPLARLQGDAV